jgi:hypothetical protein
MRSMDLQAVSTHIRCQSLERLPVTICAGGPLFELGKVVFEPGTWEVIPSSILLRALELHSCGVFGKLELYEIQNNFENVRRLEKIGQGQQTYIGCIFSRWCPRDYLPFNVLSYWTNAMQTAVVAIR